MTNLEKYNKLTTELQKLKFYFSISKLYSNCYIRKYKSGVKVINKITKTEQYFEMSDYSNTIIEYLFTDGKIGQCTGEIDLDIFEENLEYNHSLLKG